MSHRPGWHPTARAGLPEELAARSDVPTEVSQEVPSSWQDQVIAQHARDARAQAELRQLLETHALGAHALAVGVAALQRRGGVRAGLLAALRAQPAPHPSPEPRHVPGGVPSGQAAARPVRLSPVVSSGRGEALLNAVIAVLQLRGASTSVLHEELRGRLDGSEMPATPAALGRALAGFVPVLRTRGLLLEQRRKPDRARSRVWQLSVAPADSSGQQPDWMVTAGVPIARRSARGHDLAYRGPTRERPVLTVDTAPTWSGLVLLHPDGRVEDIPFPDGPVREGEPAHRDGVPNPDVVRRFAVAQELELDLRGLESMVGRWEMRVRGTYSAEP